MADEMVGTLVRSPVQPTRPRTSAAAAQSAHRLRLRCSRARTADQPQPMGSTDLLQVVGLQAGPRGGTQLRYDGARFGARHPRSDPEAIARCVWLLLLAPRCRWPMVARISNVIAGRA